MRGIHHQVAKFKRLENLICGKDPIPFGVKSAEAKCLIYHTFKQLKFSPPPSIFVIAEFAYFSVQSIIYP